MSDRDLARRHEPDTAQQTRVCGELTLRPDELVVRLRPTPVTEQTERAPRTVTTRLLAEPAQPGVYPVRSRWVWDREAVTAVLFFALVVVVLVTFRLVIP